MRFAILAIAACLTVGIVTWNVVFDRGIRAAEQRYLALERQHASVTIRQVMDPAIHHAAAVAAAWASVLTGACVLVVFGATRARRRRRQSQDSQARQRL